MTSISVVAGKALQKVKIHQYVLQLQASKRNQAIDTAPPVWAAIAEGG